MTFTVVPDFHESMLDFELLIALGLSLVTTKRELALLLIRHSIECVCQVLKGHIVSLTATPRSPESPRVAITAASRTIAIIGRTTTAPGCSRTRAPEWVLLVSLRIPRIRLLVTEGERPIAGSSWRLTSSITP